MIADMLVELPSLGWLHFGHLRAVILVLIFLLFVGHIKHDVATKTVFGFCAYLVLLLPAAIDLSVSANGVVRQVVALLMFPVEYVAIVNLKQFRGLSVGMVLAVGILLVNFVLAQWDQFNIRLEKQSSLSGARLYTRFPGAACPDLYTGSPAALKDWRPA